MPDPRTIHLGGEIYIGFQGGGSTAYDPYGRRPWDEEFGVDSSSDSETLHRFQGEFARIFGPFRRGRAMFTDRLDSERDSDDFHAYHLSLEKQKYALIKRR